MRTSNTLTAISLDWYGIKITNLVDSFVILREEKDVSRCRHHASCGYKLGINTNAILTSNAMFDEG